MTAKPLTLWRLTWSHALGVYWLPLRACADDSADAWLDLFKRDEPQATFCLSRKRPAVTAADEPNARHAATA